VRRSLVISAGCVALLASLAHPAAATWTESTVSNFGNSDSQTSRMLLSPTGDAYVAWQAQGSDELFWAQKMTTGWQKTTVTGKNTFVACYTANNARVGPSAALLVNGGAAIASACESISGGSKTMFSHKGSTWTTTKVGYGPSSSSCRTSATDVDLVVSPGGKPVIFTTDQCLGGVYGFFRTPSGWKSHWVLKGCLCGPFAYGGMSLAVDPATGNIAMAMNGDVFGRDYMFFEEFDWRGDPVDGTYHSFALGNGDSPYGEPSLAFTPTGTAYLAFQEGTPPGTDPSLAYSFLALSRGTATGWRVRTKVDTSQQFIGAEPDLSLAGGSFRIAYYDDTNRDLRLAASTDAATWTFETLASTGSTGRFPSLAVSPTGSVAISFYRPKDRSLRAVFGH
jgi:hypothetical protein